MSKTQWLIGGASLWLVLVTVARADEPPLERFEFVETHMGSSFQVFLYTTDRATASRASQAAYRRIAQLDISFSDYNAESELSLLCDRAGGPPVGVSDDLFRILGESATAWRRTGGAFDVTVGPVVRLWRRARRTRKLPDPETLARARALVGFQNVRLDAPTQSVTLLKPGMKLDLGGIAKGYAAGAAIAALKESGVSRALVAGAGDIVTSGPPPGASGWSIGIAPLEAPSSAPARFLLLHDAAVSTSGDAERFVEIDGKRYSHIVDPQTGLGLVDRISVTVVAPRGETADYLDTAVCVLGPEKGLALVDATEGAAALIVRATEAGQKTYESKRWNSLPKGQPKQTSQ
ncbi:MAG TPA: FAD:protein FMN transferase [Isosphaeraceae bacterium]|nr:FAD:protein FMN transferase [Isosphaeraceae bacterium]